MSAFKRPFLKTYSHLAQNRRLPTEYELVTSSLLYYPPKGGFEVDVPLGSWYERYQRSSMVQCRDWDLFRDPRETTYTKYTSLQKSKEGFVNGILQSIEDTRYDSNLHQEWLKDLSKSFAPLRYPWHGFQMVAAYIGQMAPGGRITIAAMFQAADEMRRIQRVAYRTRQLQLEHPGFAEDSRRVWEQEPAWQTLREAVERLLVTFDWGESFVALNLCLKPVMDELFMLHFAALAKNRGDYLLREIFHSLYEDSQWQREWSRVLAHFMIADRPENASALSTWIAHWAPIAGRAAEGICSLFSDEGRSISGELRSFHRRFLDELGLAAPGRPPQNTIGGQHEARQ